jgi:alkaline phosphatase
MRAFSVITSLLCSVLFVACRPNNVRQKAEPTPTSSYQFKPNNAKPKGIILVIGDGMGPGPVSLLLQARPEGGLASLMRTGVMGLVDVAPYGALVTDSAAAGTALSCGVQTRPRMVAMDPNGEAVETILEAAKRANIATGVVTTSALTDATPATFLAHSVSRLETKEIAEQIIKNPATIVVGGGAPGFPINDPGYVLYGVGDLPFAITNNRPSLIEMTRKALKVLEASSRGYVLIIESAHIDKACHANNAPALYAELLDLDALLEELVPMVISQDILLVVTSDHDTGGFGFHYRRVVEEARGSAPKTLPSGEVWSPGADFGLVQDLEMLAKGETPPSVTWSTYTHTSSPVSLVSLGPGAELFGGLHFQWQVGRLLREQLERMK